MKVKKAVIPAAGLGTRMLPATKSVPKEMLPLADKPSIQYIVEEAVASGIEDILIITGRQKTAMEDYFDYHPELEERMRRAGMESEAEELRRCVDLANVYFIRQKETKGLGHAVWCAKNFVGNEPFAVLLGDDIMRSKTPVVGQLVELNAKYGCSVVGVKEVSSCDVVKYCSLDVSPILGEERSFDVKSLIEKPTPEQIMSNYAILGRYVLTPELFGILETLPPGRGGEIQLTDGINALCERERVIACDFEGRRYDTGNLCGYLEAMTDIALEHPQTGEWFKNFIIDKANKLK